METLMAGFHYWLKGGWLLAPIAGVCFLIWYYLVSMDRQFRGLTWPAEWEENRLENRLSRRTDWEALTHELAVRQDLWHSMVSWLLDRLRERADLSETVEEARMRILSPFEGRLVVLGALVTAAPLLGLLGTIFGMIETFQAIAEQGSRTTEIMASGISQGLITTQFGLVVAIPGIFGIAVMKKRMRQVEVRLAGLKNHLMFALRRDGT